jgi:hypothetical protein
VPACSTQAKWNAATRAMPDSAWSPTLLAVGIAGWPLMVAICSKLAPKSGFLALW